jgi:hypothetical protein
VVVDDEDGLVGHVSRVPGVAGAQKCGNPHAFGG